MNLYLKIMVRKMKNNEEECNNCLCDDCYYDSDEDDYMLEQLEDMRSTIDFMIQTLKHRKMKSKTYQDILSYKEEDKEEDEEYDGNCSDNVDVEKIIEALSEILKQRPRRSKYKDNYYNNTIAYPFLYRF